MHLAPGSIIAEKYEVLSLVGQGGMGVVYRARQIAMDRIVALKVLLCSDNTEEWLARFMREAQILSSLKHRNLLACYELSSWNGRPFVAMEYADARSLEESIGTGGRLGVQRTLHVARQIAEALICAHAAGIVHRDLKPSNILLVDTLDEKDVVKVIDFGLAKIMTGFGKTEGKLTETGYAVGSVQYMSPEQCVGGKVDFRSDIYSLGAIMYQCLVGSSPFDADIPVLAMHRHLSVIPEKLTSDMVGEELPAGLDNLVARCLAKDPDERYQSVSEFLVALNMVACNKGADITVYIPPIPAIASALDVGDLDPTAYSLTQRRRAIRTTALGVAIALLIIAPFFAGSLSSKTSHKNATDVRTRLLKYARTKESLAQLSSELAGLARFDDAGARQIALLELGTHALDVGQTRKYEAYYMRAANNGPRKDVNSSVAKNAMPSSKWSAYVDVLSAMQDRTEDDIIYLVGEMRSETERYADERQLLDFMEADLRLETGAYPRASEILRAMPQTDMVHYLSADLAYVTGDQADAEKLYSQCAKEAADPRIRYLGQLGVARMNAVAGRWDKFRLPEPRPSDPNTALSYDSLYWRQQIHNGATIWKTPPLKKFWAENVNHTQGVPRVPRTDFEAFARAAKGIDLPHVASKRRVATQMHWQLFWDSL